MMRSLKKNRKKGFTLVELIVVLVILAILAALLIPALTGYIDKAKEKQVVSETRSCVMAAQTLVDEKYANVNPGAGASISIDYDKVEKLAEVKGTITEDSIEISAEGVVTELEYTANNGKKCTYNSSPASGKDMYEVQ